MVMIKMCISTRDEILIVDLEQVVYFHANGNYTEIMYIEGKKQMITVGISKIEEYLRKALPKNSASPFIRMGRSLIINQTYLYSINVLKQQLALSDFKSHTFSLKVPKQLLKQYKEHIRKEYDKDTNE